MSVCYVAVQWNRHKKVYDAFILMGVVLYLGMFVSTGKLLQRGNRSIGDEVLALRALGSCAFVMLSVALSVGPLTRLDRRFLPLLYNRRHLGVATFLVALAHGVLALGYYHGFGRVNPLLSLLATNTNFSSIRAFPFQVLGAVALLILFLMAATSHDFWNRNLGPRAWKTLHMGVYVAYALVVWHVALGAWQADRGMAMVVFVSVIVLSVVALHLVAGLVECRRDRACRRTDSCNRGVPVDAPLRWTDACGVDEVPESRAMIVRVAGGERIAVFRYGGGFSAITNVCAHQGGPLGEGRIVDGCVTCPWHGWQYRPADGQAPPPFTEKIPTFRVKVEGGRVWVDPRPLPAGTHVEPANAAGVDHG